VSCLFVRKATQIFNERDPKDAIAVFPVLQGSAEKLIRRGGKEKLYHFQLPTFYKTFLSKIIKIQ